MRGELGPLGLGLKKGTHGREMWLPFEPDICILIPCLNLSLAGEMQCQVWDIKVILFHSRRDPNLPTSLPRGDAGSG